VKRQSAADSVHAMSCVHVVAATSTSSGMLSTAGFAMSAPLVCVRTAAHAAASFTGLQGLMDGARQVTGCHITQGTGFELWRMAWQASVNIIPCRITVLVHGGHLEVEDLANNATAHDVV